MKYECGCVEEKGRWILCGLHERFIMESRIMRMNVVSVD